MKPNPAELHQITPEIAIWHRYDPQVKADLFSSALRTPDGLFLVDPIQLDEESLARVTSGVAPAAVIVTNSNHFRDSASFAERFGISVITAAQSTEFETDELSVIAIEGAAPGEIALHWPRGGGTLIIGDALINFGSHGFTFLPAKYATNARLMRKSLRTLLDLSFARILFAHGTPITTRAQERLAALLDEEQ